MGNVKDEGIPKNLQFHLRGNGKEVRLPRRGEVVDGVDDCLAELSGRAPGNVVRDVPAHHSIVELLDRRKREYYHKG